MNQELTQQIQALLETTYPSDEPGAAVIVVKDGQTIFRGASGMANLELNVPIRPEMVFRLGSITKQFTAVSILLLVQRGQISLQDELTKFIPDYPTQGHRVTIEHLLTHTSGIKSYTELAEWLPIMRTDLSVDQLSELFKNRPFDFEPGEKWKYNNSAYVLLGGIIERVSGMPYAQFVKENIFEPLGMSHSYYDDTTSLIPGRVSGYQKGLKGYENAAFLSMTQPHAAGSLASSVDDMAIWDTALYTDKLLPQATLAKAWKPYQLSNGESTHYGYGWSLWSYEGHPVIEHSGGINGFITNGIRLPDDRVYVCILTNNPAAKVSPDKVSLMIASLIIGKPYRDPEPIVVDEKILASYDGVYSLEEAMRMTVTHADGHLVVQMPGLVAGGTILAFPMTEDQFFFKENTNRIIFEKDAQGKVVSALIKPKAGTGMRAMKTEKALPSERPSIRIDPANLERYTGIFEIEGIGVRMVVSREGDCLMIQAPGQEKAELFAESEKVFFLRVADAEMEFEMDLSGTVTGMMFQMGRRKLLAKKVG